MNTLAEHPYQDAYRYIENAHDLLKAKAGKENGFYRDQKYVRMAGDTAWKGVLIAVEYWLSKKGIRHEKRNRPDVQWYMQQISRINRKLNDQFDDAYNILHKSMGYDGIKNANVVTEGLSGALSIVSRCEGDS